MKISSRFRTLLPTFTILTILTLIAGSAPAGAESPVKSQESSSAKGTKDVQVYYDAQGKPVANYVWSKRSGKPVFMRNAPKLEGDTASGDATRAVPTSPYSLPVPYEKLLAAKDEEGNAAIPKLVPYKPLNSYRTRRYIARLNHYSPGYYGYEYGSYYGYGSRYGFSPYRCYSSPRFISYPRSRVGTCRQTTGSIFGRAGSVGFKFRF